MMEMDLMRKVMAPDSGEGTEGGSGDGEGEPVMAMVMADDGTGDGSDGI